MTVTKKEAQAALNQITSRGYYTDHTNVIQYLIDAMPDDPESRAERLGRVCQEAYLMAARDGRTMVASYVAAAAAVEAECRPREVDAFMLVRWLQKHDHMEAAAKINRFVRGEDA